MCPVDPATLTSPLPDFPGPGARIAGRYLLEAPLGRGGMGIVYQAVQLDLGRTVAIKLLPPSSDPTAAARFAREATTLAQLAHPNIVQIFDYGVDAGVAFVAMEHLVGRTLADAIRSEAPFDIGRAIAIAIEMLTALAIAHRAGIIHRDIKPLNVFLVAGLAGERVKLLDFGVAATNDGGPRLTQTGAPVGTPAYMAPEQLSGADADPRSDLHAVGLCLFETLTGSRPFAGGAVPRVDAARPDVPARLADVLERAMARDVNGRFGTAEAMLDALAPWRTGLMPPAPNPGAPAMTGPSPMRTAGGSQRAVAAPPVRGSGRLLALVAAAGVVLLGVLLAIGLYAYRWPGTSRPQATASAPPGAPSGPASLAGRGGAPVTAGTNAAARSAAPAASGARVPSLCVDGNNEAICLTKLTSCTCRGNPAVLFSRVQTKGSTDGTSRDVPGGADGQPCTGFTRETDKTGEFSTSKQESGVLQGCQDCSREKALARPTLAVPGTPCSGFPQTKGGAASGVFKAK